jgi:general secretion pathway protein H
MSTTSRRETGFTLLELIVVLAIIGVALALVAPLLARRAPGTALAGASLELTAALRGARAEAIAADRPVLFAGGADGYFIDGRWHRLAAAATAPMRVEIGGGAQIAFYPSGGSSGGRVVLRDREARREIAVDPLTGHAALLR